MSNYLVTGGCGFLGSHLVKSLLSDGHSVRVLDDLSSGNRDRLPVTCDLVEGSVLDRDIVRTCMWNIDACFHLASIEGEKTLGTDSMLAHRVNLAGSINVFDEAKVNSTPVVYASSAAVYGDNADTPLRETSMARPITAFGVDKLAVEFHARVVSIEHGVPTSGLRFFSVYGPGRVSSPSSGVIATFVSNINENEPMVIYGDGNQVRDFVYIDDAIVFLRLAMKKIGKLPQVYNVCSGNALSINKLARVMLAITGVQVPLEYTSGRRGDIRVSVGDPRRGTQSLGATTKQPLIRALRSIYQLESNTEVVCYPDSHDCFFR